MAGGCGQYCNFAGDVRDAESAVRIVCGHCRSTCAVGTDRLGQCLVSTCMCMHIHMYSTDDVRLAVLPTLAWPRHWMC